MSNWTQRSYAVAVKHGHVIPEDDAALGRAYATRALLAAVAACIPDELEGKPRQTIADDLAAFALPLGLIARYHDLDLETVFEEGLLALEAVRKPVVQPQAPTAKEVLYGNR